MKIPDGKIMIEWPDGRRREIGTMEFNTSVAEIKCRVRIKRLAIGWEFVRIGLRIWRRGLRHE